MTVCKRRTCGCGAHSLSLEGVRANEKQRIVASAKELSNSAVSIGEAKLCGAMPFLSERRRLHRVTTADGSRDPSVSRRQDVDDH